MLVRLARYNHILSATFQHLFLFNASTRGPFIYVYRPIDIMFHMFGAIESESETPIRLLGSGPPFSMY